MPTVETEGAFTSPPVETEGTTLCSFVETERTNFFAFPLLTQKNLSFLCGERTFCLSMEEEDLLILKHGEKENPLPLTEGPSAWVRGSTVCNSRRRKRSFCLPTVEKGQ